MAVFEIRQGRRRVGVREAHNAQEAVVDYVRSCGCRDDEIAKIGPARIAWRGAQYTAVEQPESERARE